MISTIDGIDSGTYDVNYRKGAKNPPLNEVWLKLIGIEQETMIVTNARFEKKRLTWRNLLRVFYLDENRIDDIDSIVEPKHRYMENTLFLSALLYLITGRTFTETDAQEKKEIKKARRKAVAEYVNRKIRDAAERKEQLEQDLHIFDGADVEAQISQATAALQDTREKIDRALAESQIILSSILEAEERAAECDVLLTRYHTGLPRSIKLIFNGFLSLSREKKPIMKFHKSPNVHTAKERLLLVSGYPILPHPK